MKDIEESELEKNIDLKKIFYRALSFWYIFPICIVLATAYSFYQYKTTTPLYSVGAKLTIGRGNSLGEGVGVANSALPSVMLNQALYENQFIILKSRKQIEKTLRQLDFGISYYIKDRYREIEIYKSTPFLVLIDSTDVKPSNLTFEMQFKSKDNFLLTSMSGIEFSQDVKFFEKVYHPKFAFTIVPNESQIENHNYIGETYRFSFNTIERLISQYQGKVNITPIRGGSSIVEISIIDRNSSKGIDFLNKLSQSSVSYTLDKKNQIASNTIEFIERQLAGVADSLSIAENVLEEFKSRHQIMDAGLQGQQLMSQLNDLEQRKTLLNTSMEYYNYLEDNLTNNKNLQTLAPPSTQGVNDQGINSYITQLQDKYSQRASLLFNSSEENPSVVRLDFQITNLKRALIEALKNARSATQFTIDDINKQLYGVTTNIKKMPKTGQALVNIERSYQMTNEMYTFLMQKRSEAQMAKASNLPDNEIVEEALYKGKVAPDIKKTLMLIVIGGLVVPAVIIFLIIFLNDKILDVDEIKELTSAPIIGQVPLEKIKSEKTKKGKAKKSILSSDVQNTILAEAFRSIRVSLGFYANQKSTKTILFTSTLPGEGKSFCTINVAHSFAQLGKKTILVEYDLRRPSVARQSGLKSGNKGGLSNYYTGEKDIENIIFTETDVPNFHIIFSGQIPPNPAELIASEETAELIATLQKMYDVVIIDTPPLGLVSDAHLLAGYADVNLLVVRHNTTPKPILKMNLRDEKTKNMHSFAIILNGIPFQKKAYNYQYGYNMRNKYITRKV